MTRPAAFSLARQRVREAGKPWVVRKLLTGGIVDLPSATYEAASSYDEMPARWRMVAWISVNGSERVYDGLEAPASEETSNG